MFFVFFFSNLFLCFHCINTIYRILYGCFILQFVWTLLVRAGRCALVLATHWMLPKLNKFTLHCCGLHTHIISVRSFVAFQFYVYCVNNCLTPLPLSSRCNFAKSLWPSLVTPTCVISLLHTQVTAFWPLGSSKMELILLLYFVFSCWH